MEYLFLRYFGLSQVSVFLDFRWHSGYVGQLNSQECSKLHQRLFIILFCIILDAKVILDQMRLYWLIYSWFLIFLIRWLLHERSELLLCIWEVKKGEQLLLHIWIGRLLAQESYCHMNRRLPNQAVPCFKDKHPSYLFSFTLFIYFPLENPSWYYSFSNIFLLNFYVFIL